MHLRLVRTERFFVAFAQGLLINRWKAAHVLPTCRPEMGVSHESTDLGVLPADTCYEPNAHSMTTEVI